MRRIVVNSYVKCSVEFTSEAIQYRAFLCQKFLIIDSISLLVRDWTYFLFSYGSVLVGYMFLEMNLFLLGYPICWHAIVDSILL